MILSPDQEMVRDAVRAFAKEELWPNAAAWDKSHEFPKAAHKGLAALGAYGICVPESLGGANLDYLTLGLVLGRNCGRRWRCEHHHQRHQLPRQRHLDALRQRRAAKEMAHAFGARRIVGLVLFDRTARGLGCIGHPNNGHAQRGCLRAQWCESSSSPVANMAMWPLCWL